ncbi:hypothetical protein F5Y10DRAFT_268317 [Nemania abortiva]|nr:hypothetical protein F5Y10DRAFT_268317 [Nemania abortiva]
MASSRQAVPYFTRVTAPHKLKANYLEDLPLELPAASDWTATELNAFRVVIKKTNYLILPQLDSALSAVDKTKNHAKELNLDIDNPTQLEKRSDRSLVADYKGTADFWIALKNIHSHKKEQTGPPLDPRDSKDKDANTTYHDNQEEELKEELEVKDPETANDEYTLPRMPSDPLQPRSEATKKRPSSPPRQQSTTEKRRRKQTDNGPFTDSGKMRVGSSSPTETNSQESQYSKIDPPFISSDPPPKTLREDHTTCLVNSFFRYVLNSVTIQDDNGNYINRRIVEVRGPKQKEVYLPSNTDTERRWSITAEDDGGIGVRKSDGFINKEDEIFSYASMVDFGSYVAIFESKKEFQEFDNKDQPIISDKLLGQMTAEAVVGRMVQHNAGYQHPDIFVVTAARFYLRFLHFSIPSDYLSDITTNTPKTTLNVTTTRWLDINDPKDRQYAVRNVVRLMAQGLKMLGDL